MALPAEDLNRARHGAEFVVPVSAVDLDVEVSARRGASMALVMPGDRTGDGARHSISKCGAEDHDDGGDRQDEVSHAVTRPGPPSSAMVATRAQSEPSKLSGVAYASIGMPR